MKFKEFEIKKDILNAVRKAGYEEATPIQEKAIPVILEGHDVIGLAQTGTGKTAAFALPILNNIEFRKKKRIRALVLAPTRELAIQTFENFKKFGRYMDLRTVCLYGGSNKGAQITQLRKGTDIVVATPGRLLDLYDGGFVKLSSVEYFVLDEADRMLDMGFILDIRKINELIPDGRQMIMFSATMDKSVEALANQMLKDPVRIEVTPQNNAADTVEQHLIFTEGEHKDTIIIQFLKREINSPENKKLPRKERKNAIIFARTKKGAERLDKTLRKNGLQSVAIHGDKTQGQRKDALDRFRTGQIQILVATDVAARGIDIPKLNYVFNYDLPMEPDNYIHRIGRTGRAGESGQAFTLCCEDELSLLFAVESLLGTEIPEMETEWSVKLKRFKKSSGNRDRRNGNKRDDHKRDRHKGKKEQRNDRRKDQRGKNASKKENPLEHRQNEEIEHELLENADGRKEFQKSRAGKHKESGHRKNSNKEQMLDLGRQTQKKNQKKYHVDRQSINRKRKKY